MSTTITAVNIHGASNNVSFDRNPDTCPMCHRHVSVVPMFTGVLNGLNNAILQIVYRCPSHQCGRFFLGCFESEGGARNQSYLFRGCLPRNSKSANIPDSIKAVSPKYAAILEEAEFSEALGLKHISGPGYRKALEFLVKDFISSNSAKLGTDVEIIKKMPLGNCIKQFIDDPVTKKAAERASWLGNDETHYMRIWEDKDLQDLKKLIRVTQNAIDSHVTAGEYEATMPGKSN